MTVSSTGHLVSCGGIYILHEYPQFEQLYCVLPVRVLLELTYFALPHLGHDGPYDILYQWKYSIIYLIVD